jgi:hypothetical protein
MWNAYDNPSDEFDDIIAGELLREALSTEAIKEGDVLLLGNKDGCGAFKKKYSISPTFFQVLNPDKLNRLDKFWIVMTSLIPGPKHYKDQDVFLMIEQIELKMLNNGMLVAIISPGLS